MRVAVTGASGLIGSALVANLASDSHEVLRLVRRSPEGADEVQWSPMSGDIDLSRLDGVDAIVHLAGAGVGDHRWTDSYKTEIRDSRVLGTETIARAAAELSPRLSVLISQSAIGYYGDRGDARLDESASKGTGFLSDVIADWEAAANPARHAGVRVVHPRTGLVVSKNGGGWKPLFTQFKFGVGGRIGSGNQYWPFISLRDEIRALRFLIDNPAISGPVNVTAPEPVTNREATKALAQLLHRPAILPAPAFALKLALGEFSSEILSSSRVVPARLMESGFEWLDPTMPDALRATA